MHISAPQAKLSTLPREAVRSRLDPFDILEVAVIGVALAVSGVCIAVISRILWIFV